jgi:ribosome-associated translation inhibitor RaiA
MMAPFRIEIRLRNVSLSEPLRQFVEQELQAWLAPWAELIEVVRVRLSDRGDTRGGTTKECSLAIEGKAGWLAVADQATPDLRSTIRAAAGAAAAEVPRQLENRSRFPLLRHKAAVNRSRIRRAGATTASSPLRMARKIAVAVIGLSVLAIGIALIVLPGPALVVIPVGLAILATEFLWARRLLHRLKERARRMVGQPPQPANSETPKP